MPARYPRRGGDTDVTPAGGDGGDAAGRGAVRLARGSAAGDRTRGLGERALVRLGPIRVADFGFFAALQPVAASLHGREELRHVHLEGVEDVVGVVLGAQADLALACTGVLDDLVGLALGLLHDLLLADQADLLL